MWVKRNDSAEIEKITGIILRELVRDYDTIRIDMKYKAIIFDLFGTLIKSFSFQEYEAVLKQMASVLSAPSESFVRLWSDTFNERITGVFKTPDDNVEYICQKLGIPVEDSQVSLAAHIRFEFTAQTMTPMPESVATLSHLKSKGYKIGLITDCSAEIPTIWQDTPFAPLFDVTVFSCVVGMKKPDPRIYYLATERLMVELQSCLYIGDGGSKELTGAATVGMHPVLIRFPDENNEGIYRVNAETEAWNGPAISSLREVLTLVG